MPTTDTIAVALPPLEHNAGPRAWKRAVAANARARLERDRLIRHYARIGYSAETIQHAYGFKSKVTVYNILNAKETTPNA